MFLDPAEHAMKLILLRAWAEGVIVVTREVVWVGAEWGWWRHRALVCA